MEKFKIIVSDCHLSAGRHFEGKLNPHEDFFYDEEFCEFLDFFSSGKYGVGPRGPVDVELVINGDFLDFLTVPYRGEFEDLVTEEIALSKLECIIHGHSKVMMALKRFAAQPNKRITYLIGNHDIDLFFPKIRERITREWDPEGEYPSAQVEVIRDRPLLTFEGGVEVQHGSQYEAIHWVDFEHPISDEYPPLPILNFPWGSTYVLKIITRFKGERDIIDKIRPIKVFILFGLLFDFFFTIRFIFLSGYYFFKTRFSSRNPGFSHLKTTWNILKEEARLFHDHEEEARKILDEKKDVKTVIFGHTHHPLERVYPDGKQYINTGSWTRMINLDYRRLGQRMRMSFALVQIKGQESFCELRQWIGEQGPHIRYRG